jgi:hypothetical protein
MDVEITIDIIVNDDEKKIEIDFSEGDFYVCGVVEYFFDISAIIDDLNEALYEEIRELTENNSVSVSFHLFEDGCSHSELPGCPDESWLTYDKLKIEE